MFDWHKMPPKYVCLFIYSLCVLTSLCFSLQEGKYYLRRCIDSGLWVPESGEGDEAEEEDEDEEED